jgi:hypothetical protein
VTVVKSVTWAPNASNGDAARVLVLTDTIVEEWEVDCDGGGGVRAGADAPRVGGNRARATNRRVEIRTRVRVPRAW